MPKCDTEAIKAEIASLQQSGHKCAVYYLKAELKRRKASQTNKGAPVKNDTPKHRSWRKASAKYRLEQEAKEAAKQIDESIETPFQDSQIIPIEDI